MCEPPAYQEESLRTARKPHRCCECRREIAPGEFYEHVRGVWDGEWHVFKTCVECAEARAQLLTDLTKQDPWACLAFGELRETLEELA